MADITEKIKENTKKIFLLEHSVLNNQASAYLTRSAILENRNLIDKNYDAAFMGNRQLTNANTEAIFRNRLRIVKNLPEVEPLQKDFKEAMINKVTLEYLDHRGRLNSRANNINKELLSLNSRLIEITEDILATNEDISKFNQEISESNRNLIQYGISNLDSLTSVTVEKLVESNLAKIDDIQRRVSENETRNKHIYQIVKQNRASIEANAQAILLRRVEIEANQKLIQENANLIASMIK